MKLTPSQSLFIHLVRGLSALAVVVGHALASMPDAPDFTRRYSIQSYAVVIFFVLSGLLVCFVTIKRGDNYSFTEYWIDRFCRIFVVFVPALFFIAIVDTIFGIGEQHTIRAFVGNLFMLQNVPFDRLGLDLAKVAPFGSGRQLWTISLEWWLYMAFGVIYFAARLSWREVPFAIVYAAVSIPITIYFGFYESIDMAWILAALLVLGALSIPQKTARQVAIPLLLFCLIVLAYRFHILDRASHFNAYDIYLIIGTCFVIYAGVIAFNAYPLPERAIERLRPSIKWLSDISYSLYLVHYTMQIALASVVKLSLIWFIPHVIATVLVAWAFTFAFDQHHARVAAFLKRLLRVDGKHS